MLSWIYKNVTTARNLLFDRGVLKSARLGAPVISVGNITVGGTGKTPLVALIAEMLSDQGLRVCVLTRGYGRRDPGKRVLVSDGSPGALPVSADEAGDEPAELARKLAGKAVIVADADRNGAGQWALEAFGIDVFVLDDGFQHRQLQRDLDIVCIDATNPFGNFKTLPFGILRERAASLGRADLIVITRANLVSDDAVSTVKARVNELAPDTPVLVSRNEFGGLKPLHLPSEPDKPAFAFCALGNPGNFFDQLTAEKFDIRGTRRFPDHHRYTQNDADDLFSAATASGAEILITTAKDAVKLESLTLSLPCLVAENTLSFNDGNRLREMISGVAKGAHRQ